jgi:hypothetical protein
LSQPKYYWFIDGKRASRRIHIRHTDKSKEHPAISERGYFSSQVQVLLTPNLLDWVRDARLRLSEQIGVSVQRIPQALILEACLNAFLQEYQKLEDFVWEIIETLRQKMGVERKRRVIFWITEEQQEKIDAAIQWIHEKYGYVLGNSSVMVFAILYKINDIDPRFYVPS